MVWPLLRESPLPMRSPRTILLVEADPGCAQALTLVLERQGDRVRVAATREEALGAARREPYDVAIVDLFVRGGGTELARALSRHVPRLLLCHGAQLQKQEILEAALGFPVCRKTTLPSLLKGPGASSSGRASGATRPGSRRPAPDATGSSRELRARVPGRARRLG
jgi:CheY-like chemotaxis protein